MCGNFRKIIGGIIIQDKILSLLNEIKQFLDKDSQIIDFKKAENLTQNYLDKLKSCIKPNQEIISILKNKVNFRTTTDLQDFALKILGKESKFNKRKDIELDIAILLTQKKIGIEKLLPYIKPVKTVKKRVPSKKKRKISLKKRPKISDQVKNWMLMKLEDVKGELNDVNKYPDGKSLKQAGNSLLRQEDKRKRKREKIVELILKRLAEEKSILVLGT